MRDDLVAIGKEILDHHLDVGEGRREQAVELLVGREIHGPILVDFSLATDIQKNLEDGVFSVEVTNHDIVQTLEHGHGPLAELTMGCVIPSPSLSGLKTKVSTVAGMAMTAEEGELYFNLHTKGQTFYGDIRGQILPVDDD